MKGRKVNVEKKELVAKLFTESVNREEFVKKMSELNVKESSANVYWYTLCKENNRVVKEKRGRRSSKVNDNVAVEKLNKVLSLVTEEFEKAKAAKKSTGFLKQLLEVVA